MKQTNFEKKNCNLENFNMLKMKREMELTKKRNRHEKLFREHETIRL